MSIVAIARPAPFTMQPMLPSETDVVQRELRGLDLERILFGDVAQLFEVWMPVQGVVVEAHLGIERQEITALGEDQRIDLDHRGIGLDERLVDGVEELDQLAGRCPAQPHTERELAALKGGDAGSGVDVLARIFSGSFAATSSMSMPPAALAMMTGDAVARSIRMLR
jgi:hypothetical protein